MESEKKVEERNKNLIRHGIEEIWNNGNYSILEDIIASDFVIRSLNPTNEIQGLEGARKFFTSLREAFPDIKFTIREQVAEGNKVATQWTAEGTHLGSFEGIPPTGKHFKVSAIDIDYVKDGRVTECWSNMDELGLLKQLGVFEQG